MRPKLLRSLEDVSILSMPKQEALPGIRNGIRVTRLVDLSLPHFILPWCM